MPSPTTTEYIVEDYLGHLLNSGFKTLPLAKARALEIASDKNLSTQVVRTQRQVQYTATVQGRPPPIEDNNP
jgi:hypothetical protein